MKHEAIISQMTLEEKLSMLSGDGPWRTQAIPRFGVPSITVSDGPHGLRKPNEKSVAVNDSVKATCFPTAVTVAASWDKDLAKTLGETIAEECLAEDVGILLGPGVNIKRSPLCGRNFEYFSEDPYLAGYIASAFINGVQSKGVGTSLKHFACNNQEERRLSISSTVDMRTLRELYLTQFEIAVKNSHPYTLMCSYNKVNKVYSSENKLLLTDILRNEWGYSGVVMSDWGAVNDRARGVPAGLDLEMPGCNGKNDRCVIDAVNSGKLDVKYVDQAVDNMLDLVFRCQKNAQPGYTYSIEKHNEIAQKVAEESAVLLKNENNILPLDKNKKILVLGALAETPRYQGAGSSHVNSHKITSLLDGLDALGVRYEYAPGYTLDSKKSSVKAREAAVALARNYDTILMCIGLTDEYEAEGFDRLTLDLPQSQLDLMTEITKLSKNIVVNLQCGSPVTMPWLSNVQGLLLSYLGGQATGGAAANLLYGMANPSGKLAETFPLALEDTPCYRYFPGDGRSVLYREGVYVGYRYYTTAQKDVLFPFGYGLSYTSFQYDKLDLKSTQYHDGDAVEFSVTVSNTGDKDGKEVVEVYVHPHDPKIDRPDRELKAFKKVFVKAHSSETVSFSLSKRDFCYYDVDSKAFVLDQGKYDIIVAKNVMDSSLVATVEFVDGNTKDKHLSINSWYNHPSDREITKSEFAELLRMDLPERMIAPKKGEFKGEHLIADLMPTSGLARGIAKIARFGIRTVTHVKDNDPGLEMGYRCFIYTPLYKLPAFGYVLSKDSLEGVTDVFNGHPFKGTGIVIKDFTNQLKKHIKKKK